MSRSATLPGPRPGRRMSPGCRHAMEERLLGGTGLRVSSLALGTLTWSRDTDEEEAASLLHDFVDAGGTLVDTAASYADGAAEALVGNLLGGVVAREDVLLCTKAGIRRTAAGGVVDASRGSLLSTLDASLARLGTDHVDLWLVQSPDPGTPLEESVGALLQRGAGIGGLHQPEVDVIGVETREGGIEGGQQGTARRVDHAAGGGPADPGLGAQQDVLARDHTAEQVSDQGLGCAVGVGGGCVDKGSAGVDEVVQQRRCLLFVGVTAPAQGLVH